jgi:integrase
MPSSHAALLKKPQAACGFADFLNDLNAADRGSTAQTYGYLWRPFARWMVEHGRDAERFTVADVKEYLASWSDVSDSTKNVYLAVVKRFAKWHRARTADVQERMRLEQICGIIRFKPTKLIKRKALSLEELKLLIDVAKDKDSCLIYLLSYLGLRIGEAGTIHDVDFERGRLIVVTEKTKAERILYFNAECGRVLKLAIEKRWFCLKPGSLGRRLKCYNSMLTGIRLTPKSCRHTFNTWMRGRIPDPLLRILMGHTERSISDTYTTAFEDQIRDAMTSRHYLADFRVPTRIKELG